MVHTIILTEAFAEAALKGGHTVVFMDEAGRCVEEWPNGERFEIRLDPSQPRESHRVVLRKLTSSAD